MLRARKTRAIVHVLCSPEKQKKNRARSLSLLHLPPKDGSETGADQGAYMDKDSPPVWLVVLIFPVFRPPIPRKFSHCNKPLLLFVCFTGEGIRCVREL